MDRLNRIRIAAGGGLALALVVGGTGCKSTRSEVPPHRAMSPDGQPTNPVAFSNAPSTPPLAGLPAGGGQYGTPAPGANPYGAPTGNTFGPPGSAGLSPGGAANSSAGAASGVGLIPGSAAGLAGSDPTTGIPQNGTGPVSPVTAPAPLPGPGGAPGGVAPNP